jgi:thymidylate synthase ThyX
MAFKADVILDSISKAGSRLITMELTYPRFIHAEFMTHRMFSRNAASSRAIPTKKMIKMVEENPAMPIYFGKNIRGMSAREEIDKGRVPIAEELWLAARDEAVAYAKALYELGMHKQVVNRVLEPWKYITVICTATQWSNFFALRRHEDAQPEIHHLADLMHAAQSSSEPVERTWHIPYIQEDEQNLSLDIKCKIGTARCARVSYLTHAGKREIEKDLVLHERLLTGSGHGHWSPFEHVAMASSLPTFRSGNFLGWRQYRKMFEGECK